MEDQQKRHIKKVYMDSALRSLASEHGSDNSVSNVSFKSAHTQDTAIARINAMLTESINAGKAEFFDLYENGMEPQHELESSSSSSDGGTIIVEIIFTLVTILIQLGILKTNQC